MKGVRKLTWPYCLGYFGGFRKFEDTKPFLGRALRRDLYVCTKGAPSNTVAQKYPPQIFFP